MAGHDPETTARHDAPMDSAVVLLSGGLDSSTLLHYVRQTADVARIHALTLFYGQKHEKEIDMARWQARRVGVREHHCVDMSFYGALSAGGSALTDAGVSVPDLAEIPACRRRQPPTYVPHRNLVMLSVAAGYAESRGIRDVFYGAQAQDEYGYWDCTEDFVSRLNGVLSLNRGQPVRVHAPFVSRSKRDVLKIGLALGVDYRHTWTCYRGGQVPCGSCPSCVERASAFAGAGVPDPLDIPETP